MFELLYAGGILIIPLLVLSVLMVGIIGERIIRLRTAKVLPAGLTVKTILHMQGNTLTSKYVAAIASESPLGAVLAAALLHAKGGLNYMTMQVEQVAAAQLQQMERHLSLLGTIAYIAPLLGLLGTVLGIIKSFMAVSAGAAADPGLLAQGISEALITTAVGMFVAIPATIGVRALNRHIANLTAALEAECSKVVQAMFGSGEDKLPRINQSANSAPL